MNRIKFLLCLALFLMPVTAFAGQFDEKAIQRLLTDLEQAIQTRDATAYAAFFSDDVIVTGNYHSSGQTQKVTLNKAQYVAAIKQVWATATDYKFSKANVTVKIVGPTNAVVTATVTETVTLRGQTTYSTTDETITVDLVGDKPLITSIFGESKVTREQAADANLRLLPSAVAQPVAASGSSASGSIPSLSRI